MVKKLAEKKRERAPLCKICKHRHFGVDHIWPKPLKEVKKNG